MAIILQRISDKLVGEISEEEKLEITLPTALGRGPILKCPEKKVSRNHATLDWDDDGCLITSTHSSPTFLRVDGEERLLSKGQTAVLKNGDKFGLQKEFYWYKVIVESPVTNEIQSNTEENKNESNFENNLKDSNDHIAQLFPTDPENSLAIQSVPSTSAMNESDGQKDLKSLPILEETNKEHITERIWENSDKEKIEEIGETSVKVKIEEKTENDSINLSSEVKSDSVIHTEEKDKEPVGTSVTDPIISPTTTEVDPVFTSEQRERKLPAWMSNKENVSTDKDKIKTDNASSLQKQQGRGVKRPKATTNSPRKKRPSPSKPSAKPNQYHAVSQDFVDSEKDLHNLSEDDESIEPTNQQIESPGQTLPSPTKQPAGNKRDAPRDACLFGSQCYRKNSSHGEELSHPGDSDYVAPADDADDDLPECEFGVDCYRKNPDHKRQFRHTRKPQPQRQAKRKAKRRRDSGSDDDYDLDDPFLYDGSSDDYAPSDEDSSNEDESQDYKLSQEEKDTLRMIKEAKKFVKKS